MSTNGIYGTPMAHSCRSYCNKSGYYSDGFSCGIGHICCGGTNVRYCCGNASLGVPSSLPDKCYCPQSSCTQLSWDILLPCVASGLFVLLMIAICCCQGCRRGARFRRWWQTACLRQEAEAAEPESSVANVEPVPDPGMESSFPHLPPYEFGPPKYDSLELTEAPPKYEEAMRQQEQQQFDNVAFVGDGGVTHSCDVTLDDSVTRHDRNSSPDVGGSLATRHRAEIEIEIETDCGTSQGQGRTTQGQDRASQGRWQGQDTGPSPAMSVSFDDARSCQGRSSDRSSESFLVPQTAVSSSRDPGSTGSLRRASNDPDKIDTDQAIV